MKKVLFVILVLGCCLSISFGSSEGDLKNQLETLMQEKDTAQGIVLCRELLKEYPENIRVHRIYQNLMKSVERGGELKEEYQKHLESAKTKAIWHYLYGRLLKDTALENAFKQALALESNFFWAHYGLAHFYKDQARWTEAIKEFKIAQALSSDDTFVSYFEVIHDLALAYFYAGKSKAAQNVWQEIIKAEPDNLDARLGIGLCLKTRERYDEAIKELETLIKQNDTFWKAYEPLIQCYHTKKDFPAAERLIARIKSLYKETRDKEFLAQKEIIIDWLVIKQACLMVSILPLNSYWPGKNMEILYQFKVYYAIKRAALEEKQILPEPHQIIRVEAQRAQGSEVPLALSTWRLNLLEPSKGAWQITKTLKEYHFHIPTYPEVLDDIITYPK